MPLWAWRFVLVTGAGTDTTMTSAWRAGHTEGRGRFTAHNLWRRYEQPSPPLLTARAPQPPPRSCHHGQPGQRPSNPDQEWQHRNIHPQENSAHQKPTSVILEKAFAFHIVSLSESAVTPRRHCGPYIVGRMTYGPLGRGAVTAPS